MVEGYKILQQSVKLRNVQYKNNKPTGDPPLEYPAIGQQVKEKQRLRKMYNELMMNTYLNDSDSDFDEHASVGSDKVRHYPSRYRQMMKKNHQSEKSEQQGLGEKRRRLDYLLYRGNKSQLNSPDYLKRNNATF